MTAPGRRSFLRAGAALAVLPVTVLAGARDMGEVALRVTDHRAGIDDFHSVHVSLAEISLHPAGRGRTEGWVRILEGAAPIDIVPLKDGRWTAAGVVPVAAQRYDAIRVAAQVSSARRKAGAQVPIAPAYATVALPLAVDARSAVPVLLDFYLENQTEHDPPRYELKLRRVTVAAV